MHGVYIVGASGLAKEVANYVLDTHYSIIAFVEKDEVKDADFLQIRDKLYPVIQESAFFYSLSKEKERPKVVIAVGFPVLRHKLHLFYKKFCDFPNIIHPKAILCDTSIKLGSGNIIAPGCILTTSVIIGDFNLVNLSTTIGHDVMLGNYNVLNPLVAISGQVHIGDGNLVGCNAAIRQGVNIGDHNTIGMGAVVLKNVENDLILVGIPAKVLNK